MVMRVCVCVSVCMFVGVDGQGVATPTVLAATTGVKMVVNSQTEILVPGNGQNEYCVAIN